MLDDTLCMAPNPISEGRRETVGRCVPLRGRDWTVTDLPFDVWDRSNSPRMALVGEGDYVALRAPVAEVGAPVVPVGENVDTAPLDAAGIVPGMRWDAYRQTWLYSARWL